MTRGNRTGTERGSLVEPGLFLELPPVELFLGTVGENEGKTINSISYTSRAVTVAEVLYQSSGYLITGNGDLESLSLMVVCVDSNAYSQYATCIYRQATSL